jgi:hypothetical protein
MRIATLAAAAALLSLALPARAQEVRVDTAALVYAAADSTWRTSLQKGTWSLSFAAPGYGAGERAEFGAWEMVGARTNLGLTLGVGVIGAEVETGGGEWNVAETDVDLGIAVKRYVMEPREVTPFLLGSVAVGGRYDRRESPQYDETIRSTSAAVRAAVGVEWFPVRRVSLSGQTGFGLFAGRSDVETETPDGTRQKAETSQVSFQSFTSALSLHIYF